MSHFRCPECSTRVHTQGGKYVMFKQRPQKLCKTCAKGKKKAKPIKAWKFGYLYHKYIKDTELEAQGMSGEELAQYLVELDLIKLVKIQVFNNKGQFGKTEERYHELVPNWKWPSIEIILGKQQLTKGTK